MFFADNLLVNFGLFALGTWLRNLLVFIVSGVGVGAFLASVTVWGTLQALSTALAGTVVILAIRHRVDFRLEE